jgi:hypothetical protein
MQQGYRVLLLCCLSAAVRAASAAQPPDWDRVVSTASNAGWEYYCSGLAAQCSNSTATPPLPPPTGGQGGVVLMGGGTDVAEAFEWMGRRSNRGGLLVLRTDPSGDDAYDPFILGLGTVSSAATLILKDRAASSDPFVLRKIGEAASIFFAGGDQSKYWRFWQDTQLQTAVQARVDAGCPVGGTSAGEAILSSCVAHHHYSKGSFGCCLLPAAAYHTILSLPNSSNTRLCAHPAGSSIVP